MQEDRPIVRMTVRYNEQYLLTCDEQEFRFDDPTELENRITELSGRWMMSELSFVNERRGVSIPLMSYPIEYEDREGVCLYLILEDR